VDETKTRNKIEMTIRKTITQLQNNPNIMEAKIFRQKQTIRITFWNLMQI
jgi:hypothetical protein